MNDPPKEPPDHVESKTWSKSAQDKPISEVSNLSTPTDAILDLKKKKKMSKIEPKTKTKTESLRSYLGCRKRKTG